MKNIYIVLLVCLLLCSCGKNVYKGAKLQKTPSNMLLSHSEKQDVNYDARENSKIIEQNAKNKEANKKHAEKARQKQTEDLNKLNANSSKVKKKKTAEAFSFY